MPLLSLSGPDAIKVRKANRTAFWGDRGGENRVEPIAKPAFDVPFQFEPGETIFTIGSCFARNVEDELKKRGFRVPMRELFGTKTFENLERNIVNNFGTPSIYNELAWAFGEREFDEEESFFEVSEGKFVDLHMVPSVRPAPIEHVRARRNGVTDAIRILAECRILIMTLGLVELWWDEQSGLYLNSTPLPSILRQNPDRFALHVLSFEECHRFLRDALDIAFHHGRDDLKVVLTVSPVPMMATHRLCDVITANCYSKSMLRNVAEHIVCTDERVVYFPSYETVTLSDRRISWADDLVHVTPDMVAFNVERMVNAYTGKSKSADHLLPDIELGDDPQFFLLAEKARQARENDDEEFFELNHDAAEKSPLFAIEFARFLKQHQRFDEALQLIDGQANVEADTLRTELLLASGDYENAYRAASQIRAKRNRNMKRWRMMIDALTGLGDKQRLLDLEKEWHASDPENADRIALQIARALFHLGAKEEAFERCKPIAGRPDLPALPSIICAQVLLGRKQPRAAWRYIKDAIGNTDWENKKIELLKQRCKNRLSKTR